MTKQSNSPKRPAASGAVREGAPAPAPPRAERRRCARWNAHVPVFVYGHTCDQTPFHEDAYSSVVSERGALLVLTTAAPGCIRLSRGAAQKNPLNHRPARKACCDCFRKSLIP